MKRSEIGSDLGVLLFILLAILVLAWINGCASIEMTDPSGVTLKANLGGKGCALLERDAKGNLSRVVIEHDGMSNPLAGTLRSVVGSVANVFGGATDKTQKIQAGEGCAGVLFQSPSTGDIDESSAISEAAEGAARGAVEGLTP